MLLCLCFAVSLYYTLLLLTDPHLCSQSATAFNSGNVGSVTASATQNVISCTLSIPVADIRAVNPSFSTIRIVGGNDQTNQFIPPTGSYVATSR